MIKLEFILSESEDPGSFDIGEMALTGEHSRFVCSCMVVLTATLLMDQLARWSSARQSRLEFNPVDYTRFIIIERKGDEVTVVTSEQPIGSASVREFLQEVLRAARRLESFARTTPVDDAGRQDFEASLEDFRVLAESY